MILELNKSQRFSKKKKFNSIRERKRYGPKCITENTEHERIQIAQRNDTWECCTCSYPG